MPDYGKAKYWDDRYTSDGVNEPFDWLFNFKDLESVLSCLIPDKHSEILMVGAGNAPFSPDMYFWGGYKNICNIDLSSVVISNQSELYPEQKWLVQDVRKMDFADGYFPVVLDKSLIDTLLCYKNSAESTKAMIDEIYRVLSSNGVYITFSLHSIGEIEYYYTSKTYNWVVKSYNIRSSRWNESDNRKRSVSHAMIVCQKMPSNFPIPHISEALNDEELHELQEYANFVNFREALKLAELGDLRYFLDKALAMSQQQSRRSDANSNSTSGSGQNILSSEETVNEMSGHKRIDICTADDETQSTSGETGRDESLQEPL